MAKNSKRIARRADLALQDDLLVLHVDPDGLLGMQPLEIVGIVDQRRTEIARLGGSLFDGLSDLAPRSFLSWRASCGADAGCSFGFSFAAGSVGVLAAEGALSDSFDVGGLAGSFLQTAAERHGNGGDSNDRKKTRTPHCQHPHDLDLSESGGEVAE